MQHIIFEDASHFDLYPLTYTRPIWDLRVGITNLHEKWAELLPQPFGKVASGYLHPHFSDYSPSGPVKAYNSKFIPTADWIRDLNEALEPGSYLRHTDGTILAFQAK